MREIKFKAHSADTIEWVYGFYCELAGRKYIIPDYSQFRDIHDADLENSFTEIIPETVCQWTGLLDKQGVKIYEGDICNNCNETGVITWLDDYASYGLREYKDGQIISDRYPLFRYYELEVISNIHDKAQQKQALIDMMRGDEEMGLYDN